MKALNEINPLEDDLSKIDTKGLKILFRRFRREDYGWNDRDTYADRIQDHEKKMRFVEKSRSILKKELDTREHIPTANERKVARQQRGKRK